MTRLPYMHKYTHKRTHPHMHTFTCIYIHIHLHAYTYIYHFYVCMCMCIISAGHSLIWLQSLWKNSALLLKTSSGSGSELAVYALHSDTPVQRVPPLSRPCVPLLCAAPAQDSVGSNRQGVCLRLPAVQDSVGSNRQSARHRPQRHDQTAIHGSRSA